MVKVQNNKSTHKIGVGSITVLINLAHFRYGYIFFEKVKNSNHSLIFLRYYMGVNKRATAQFNKIKKKKGG